MGRFGALLFSMPRKRRGCYNPLGVTLLWTLKKGGNRRDVGGEASCIKTRKMSPHKFDQGKTGGGGRGDAGKHALGEFEGRRTSSVWKGGGQGD